MARVLVIEDEAPLRRIITMNLARRGHTVAEAGSVAEADEAFAAAPQPFDVILLDINLPDRTGWDVLRHLAAGGSARRPLVIITTAVRPVERRLAEFRPAAVLLKPFPIETLIRLIDRELARGPEGIDELDQPDSAAENGGPSAHGPPRVASSPQPGSE